MARDRKADRHSPDGPRGVFARLPPEDDEWFRAYLDARGMSVSEGVKAAVRAWRQQVETAEG